MNVDYTARFVRAFRLLPPSEQQAVLDAVDRVQDNLHHPSVETKRVLGRSDVWELRASLELRLTCQFRAEGIVFRVCDHRPRVRHPKA